MTLKKFLQNSMDKLTKAEQLDIALYIISGAVIDNNSIELDNACNIIRTFMAKDMAKETDHE